MNKEELFFNVEKVPMLDFFPGYTFSSDITHFVRVQTPDGPKIVNACSKDYGLRPNKELVEPFYEELSKYYKVDVKARQTGDCMFWFDFILKDKSIPILKKDDVFLKITMANSYNGKLKYFFEAGLWRLICGNGAAWPEKTSNRIKLMHTPSIVELTSYDKIMEMVSEASANLGLVGEIYGELADQVTKNVVKRVASVAEDLKFPQGYEEQILQIIENERQTLNVPQVSDWLVYNGFNNILNHAGELKMKVSRREELDRELVQYLLNY
jgi:hypothetical protein